VKLQRARLERLNKQARVGAAQGRAWVTAHVTTDTPERAAAVLGILVETRAIPPESEPGKVLLEAGLVSESDLLPEVNRGQTASAGAN